jgi:hypothetical protein
MRSSRCDRSKWDFVSEAAIVTITGLSTYWVYRLVQDYGWNGALRYIWEGDPLPHNIRQYTNTLNSASDALDEKDSAISDLEEGLERARLDTTDGSSPSTILSHWRSNMVHLEQDLRRHLAKVSFDLDILASNIDQVPTKDELRDKKKELSKRIVLLMSRTDRLIEFFTLATKMVV